MSFLFGHNKNIRKLVAVQQGPWLKEDVRKQQRKFPHQQWTKECDESAII